MNSSYFKRFRPIDLATAAYIMLEIILILVFMSGRYGWPYMLFFYVSAGGIVLLMVGFPFDESSNAGRAIRILYPMILIPFMYRAMGSQIFLVFNNSFDSIVHQFELGIFGVDPAFALQNYVDIWLNEVMSFGYFSFYLLLPLSVIAYTIVRRWESLERAVLSILLTYYVCFLIFILYPVTGPRFYLKDIYYLPIVGPVFTTLVRNIVGAGGLNGGAMPSTHCAISFVVVWRISRDFPKIAIPAFAILILVIAGAVYGRFHYLTDAVVGIIIGGLSVWVSNRWQGRFLERTEREEIIDGSPGI